MHRIRRQKLAQGEQLWGSGHQWEPGDMDRGGDTGLMGHSVSIPAVHLRSCTHDLVSFCCLFPGSTHVQSQEISMDSSKVEHKEEPCKTHESVEVNLLNEAPPVTGTWQWQGRAETHAKKGRCMRISPQGAEHRVSLDSSFFSSTQNRAPCSQSSCACAFNVRKGLNYLHSSMAKYLRVSECFYS